MLLIGPDDVMNFKKIYKALGKDEELPMFPIETTCMEAIKVRSSSRSCLYVTLKRLCVVVLLSSVFLLRSG